MNRFIIIFAGQFIFMIQRIQTVYLLLSVIATVALFFFPVWTNGTVTEQVSIGSVGAGTHIFLMLFGGITTLIQVITIFLFNRRKRQITFCRISILLNILFLVLAFVLINQEKSISSDFSIQDLRVGAVLPVLSVILLSLAIRNIRKDEALVRSMDRLR